MTQRTDNDVLTAYHESGHAVIAALSKQNGFFPTGLSIRQNKKKRRDGVMYSSPLMYIALKPSRDFCYSKAKTRIDWQCRINAAGFIAEQIFFYKTDCDFDEPLLINSDDDYKDIYDICSGFYKRKNIERYIMEIEKSTSKLLLKNWGKVELFANTLLEKRKLHSSEIFHLWYNQGKRSPAEC